MAYLSHPNTQREEQQLVQKESIISGSKLISPQTQRVRANLKFINVADQISEIIQQESSGQIEEKIETNKKDILMKHLKISLEDFKNVYKNRFLGVMQRFTQEASIIFKVKKFINNMKACYGYYRNGHLSRNILTILGDNSVVLKGGSNFNFLEENYFLQTKYFAKLFKGRDNQDWIIDPQSKFVIFWDLIHCIVSVLCLFYIPVEQVVKDSFFSLYGELWVFFLYLCLATFLLEIVYRLNVGYYEKGLCVMQRKQITQKYFSEQILIDLCPLVPLINQIFINNNNDHKSFLTFFIIAKLKRIYIIMNTYQEIITVKKELIYTFLLKLLNIFVTLIVLAHMCTLILVGMTLVQSDQDSPNWMNKYDSDLRTDDWVRQYLYAFYWSITTMTSVGYGDITPANLQEIVIMCFIMIISCFIFAYCFNLIGTIIQDIDKIETDFRDKMRMVHRYLDEKNIDHGLRTEVHKYLEYQFKSNNNTHSSDESNVLREVSKTLKQKLIINGHIQYLKKYKLFKNKFSQETLERLSFIIKPQISVSEDIVLSNTMEYDKQNLYFIENGEVDMIYKFRNGKKEILIKKMQKFDFFGEMNLIVGQQRNYTYRVSKDCGSCRMLVLKKDDFLNILKMNSSDYEQYKYIEDQVLNLQRFNKLEVDCHMCCNPLHDSQDCPRLKYVPDIEMVYLKERFSYIQYGRDSDFERQDCRTNNPRKYLQLLAECSEEIMDDVDLNELPLLERILMRADFDNKSDKGEHGQNWSDDEYYDEKYKYERSQKIEKKKSREHDHHQLNEMQHQIKEHRNMHSKKRDSISDKTPALPAKKVFGKLKTMNHQDNTTTILQDNYEYDDSNQRFKKSEHNAIHGLDIDKDKDTNTAFFHHIVQKVQIINTFEKRTKIRVYAKKEQPIDNRSPLEKLLQDYKSDNLPKIDYIFNFPNNKFEKMQKYDIFHEHNNYHHILLRMTRKPRLLRDKDYHLWAIEVNFPPNMQFLELIAMTKDQVYYKHRNQKDLELLFEDEKYQKIIKNHQHNKGPSFHAVRQTNFDRLQQNQIDIKQLQALEANNYKNSVRQSNKVALIEQIN